MKWTDGSITTGSILFLATALGLGGGLALKGATPSASESVRIFVGTADHGHTYPGATLPFGMVQVSPDTRGERMPNMTNIENWDGCSGYHYADDHIIGFSHNHLSGTGAYELGNVLLVPGTGTAKAPINKRGTGCRFSHDQEFASPGYYRVVLPDEKITAELTATERCGLHRYTFPKTDQAHIVIDLRHGIMTRTVGGSMTVENERTISGYRQSNGWMKRQNYYFVAEFSKPFKQVAINVDGKPVTDKAATGKLVWGAVYFGPTEGEAIVVKVGISAVSVEGARANLKQEVPEMDFDQVAQAAGAVWQRQLALIDAQFSDAASRETFYTAFYHAQICPNLFSDVDGSFYGPDAKSHPSEGFPFYTNFSLWDTFRAENPLITLLEPDLMENFIKTFLAHYKITGCQSLPIMPYGGHETACMIGNHSIPTIAEAYAKGVRGFDANAALDAMLVTMNQDNRHLKEYRTQGYITRGYEDGKKGVVPDDQKQSVSRTLEYAYDDACVARFAAMLGRTADAAANAARAGNWRNVFDPKTGFMRGRTPDGKFYEPFDPRVISFDDYTEANAWHYSFFVPHDIPALVQAMGGDEAFGQKFETLFTTSSELPVPRSDVTGLIGQYAHGNEPCHHVAYLCNYAGQPWRTQKWVRKVMDVLYNNTPAGQCGNDDCGQMSAWYVWSALGLYPVDPVSKIYVLGSPKISSATIRLNPKYAKGQTFTITAKNNSPENVYIQSAMLNGQPLTRSWISHGDLVAGGALVLEMGPQPNKAWGADPKDRPPAALP